MSNNKQTDHIVDTNKMVSSVEWLAIQLWEEMNMQGDGEVFNRLLDQAKAMHKEEIVQTYDDGIMKGRHQDGIEYYTYIFGGNND